MHTQASNCLSFNQLRPERYEPRLTRSSTEINSLGRPPNGDVFEASCIHYHDHHPNLAKTTFGELTQPQTDFWCKLFRCFALVLTNFFISFLAAQRRCFLFHNPCWERNEKQEKRSNSECVHSFSNVFASFITWKNKRAKRVKLAAT